VAGRPSRRTMVGAMEERGRLPGSTRLATASPLANRAEGEIGQLVVEEEAADHQARAEGAFDGRGDGGDVAVIVDDDEMGGGRLLEFEAVDAQLRAVPGRLAGRDGVGRQRVGAFRQPGALGEIVGVQEALRHVDEIGVGHVAAAIGKGQPRRVADDAPGRRVVGAERGES
jgi:hypothetical protein